jgi:hypothetical protein
VHEAALSQSCYVDGPETDGAMSTPTRSSQSSTRVQVKNPVTKQWVKLDTKTGRIVDSKKSPGPYKGIPKK